MNKKEFNTIHKAIKMMEKAGLIVEEDMLGESFDDNAYRLSITSKEDW